MVYGGVIVGVLWRSHSFVLHVDRWGAAGCFFLLDGHVVGVNDRPQINTEPVDEDEKDDDGDHTVSVMSAEVLGLLGSDQDEEGDDAAGDDDGDGDHLDHHPGHDEALLAIVGPVEEEGCEGDLEGRTDEGQDACTEGDVGHGDDGADKANDAVTDAEARDDLAAGLQRAASAAVPEKLRY